MLELRFPGLTSPLTASRSSPAPASASNARHEGLRTPCMVISPKPFWNGAERIQCSSKMSENVHHENMSRACTKPICARTSAVVAVSVQPRVARLKRTQRRRTHCAGARIRSEGGTPLSAYNQCGPRVLCVGLGCASWVVVGTDWPQDRPIALPTYGTAPTARTSQARRAPPCRVRVRCQRVGRDSPAER